MASWSPAVDIVFHQAALRITQCAAEPRRPSSHGRRDLRPAGAAASQHGVEKVVAASSASVYGLAERFPTDRGPPPLRQPHPLRRGQGVQRGPAALASTTCTASTTSRCATSTSTARAWTSTARYTEVLIRWMERIDAGEPPLIFGDGRQTMDFVHVRDVARANILAADAPATDVGSTSAAAPRPACSSSPRQLARVMGGRELRAGVRARAQGQPGAAAARRHRRRAARELGFARRDRRSRTACASWSTGGAAERGRSRPTRAGPTA